MLLDDRFIIVPVFLLLYRRRTRAQLDARIIVHKPVSPISKCLMAHLSTFTSLFMLNFKMMAHIKTNLKRNHASQSDPSQN
jgi:hypothetical protein